MTQIQSLIDHSRRLALETMIDTGTISRPSSAQPTLNETTGLLTAAAPSLIYQGPCRVRAVSRAQEQTELFGDTTVTTQRFVISFEHDIPDVEIGDLIAVSSAGDTSLASRTFGVVAVESTSVLHFRRLGVEVVE